MARFRDSVLTLEQDLSPELEEKVGRFELFKDSDDDRDRRAFRTTRFDMRRASSTGVAVNQNNFNQVCMYNTPKKIKIAWGTPEAERKHISHRKPRVKRGCRDKVVNINVLSGSEDEDTESEALHQESDCKAKKTPPPSPPPPPIVTHTDDDERCVQTTPTPTNCKMLATPPRQKKNTVVGNRPDDKKKLKSILKKNNYTRSDGIECGVSKMFVKKSKLRKPHGLKKINNTQYEVAPIQEGECDNEDNTGGRVEETSNNFNTNTNTNTRLHSRVTSSVSRFLSSIKKSGSSSRRRVKIVTPDPIDRGNFSDPQPQPGDDSVSKTIHCTEGEKVKKGKSKKKLKTETKHSNNARLTSPSLSQRKLEQHLISRAHSPTPNE